MRKGGSRELYDFRLRVARWSASWLGLRFDIRGRSESAEVAAGVCPDGVSLSGVQVMRGRSEGRDYYAFKLRCARQWRDVIGLPFDALKETRSATCPHGRDVGGIRVHRGFQDWGSIDTYEFQLMCLDEADEAHPQHEPRQQQQQQQLHGGDSAGATTLAELMAMGATDAWQLVSSSWPSRPQPCTHALVR